MAESSFCSVPEMFLWRVAQTPDRPAFQYPVADTWATITWKHALERVRAIACGLRALGVQDEQRCAILCSTRVEWILADLGILCAGGATTTIYPSNTAEECVFILSDSESRVLFAEDDAQVAKLASRRAEIPQVQWVVVLDGTGGHDGWVITLEELEERGRAHHATHPREFEEIARAIGPQDLATLIYTSGTTGTPKGVELTHDCWVFEGQSIAELGQVDLDDHQYLWLPLAHSFGKALEAVQIYVGYLTTVDGRIPKLVENLAVVQPTFMAAAPRIFEKVFNKVVAGAQEAGGLKLMVFKWSLKVGRQVSRTACAGGRPGAWLRFQYAIADRLVFARLRKLFGGKVRFFLSGSAPLSNDIAEFFHAMGILILEGYGLTETSAATFINRPNCFRFGTVGLPVGDTQVKLDPVDNEILVKGRGVMRGYHNRPEATAEVLAPDGWLRTGDIGDLGADGLLTITDRKKDLIKTSGGKYVAPQLIESRLKTLSPYISQVLVHGDRRNYCTALITLDPESIVGWAEDNGIEASYTELTAHHQVHHLVQQAVERLNHGLARYETIKKYAILPEDFTVESGDLTPSLKVKRRKVEARYGDLLDGFYAQTLQQL